MRRHAVFSFVAIGVVAAACLVAAGCGGGEATPAATQSAGGASSAPAPATSSSAPETTPAADTTNAASGPVCDLTGKTVGIGIPYSADVLNQLVADIQEFAKRDGSGLKFVVTNADQDPAKQILQAEGLIAQKVDLLMTIPTAAEGWDRVASEAKDGNVILMNWSSLPIEGATQNATVWQAKSGALVGEEAARWINNTQGGQANVGMLVSLTDPGFKQRAAAFKQRLHELAPNAKFVAEAAVGHDLEQAAKAAANMIQANPSMNVLFAVVDPVVLGADRAAIEAGKTDPSKFFLAGQDGPISHLKLMQQPTNVLQADAALLFRYDAGIQERDMEKLLCGQTVPPLRLLIPALVTKDNVDQVLAVQDNPFDPANKSWFSKITAYFNTNWTNGMSLPQPNEQPVAVG